MLKVYDLMVIFFVVSRLCVCLLYWWWLLIGLYDIFSFLFWYYGMWLDVLKCCWVVKVSSNMGFMIFCMMIVGFGLEFRRFSLKRDN